jgi:hypothetical protein
LRNAVTEGRTGHLLALTGQDPLRLKAVLEGVAGRSGRDDLVEVGVTIDARLGGYFAGLK